jgi:hypothetical protein
MKKNKKYEFDLYYIVNFNYEINTNNSQNMMYQHMHEHEIVCKTN